MALYVILANFTDQGVKAIKDTPKRAEAFKASFGEVAKNCKSCHDAYWLPKK